MSLRLLFQRPIASVTLCLLLALSSGNTWAQGSAATKQPSSENSPPNSAAIALALAEARDNLDVKRHKLRQEYLEWMTESSLAGFPESTVRRANERLGRIEQRAETMRNELEEIRMQKEVLELREKHLSRRLNEIEKQQDNQKARVKALVRDVDKAAWFQGEIKRQQALFDKLVERHLDQAVAMKANQ